MKNLANLPKLLPRSLLRFFLVFSALGWGCCVVALFVPASTAFDLLADVGSINPDALRQDAMYDYWLRMAAGAFTCIGALYLVLAIWPVRFANVLPMAGGFMIVEGLILLVHGLRLHLPTPPFGGDVAFCLIGGVGILWSMRSVRRFQSHEHN